VKKGDTKTLDLVNAGLKKVLGSPEYKAIEDKWLK
jgi:ABC-type amino acid transport substrate-binding protein